MISDAFKFKNSRNKKTTEISIARYSSLIRRVMCSSGRSALLYLMLQSSLCSRFNS